MREFLKAKCGHENYYQTYWSKATGLGDRGQVNQFIALPQEERDRFDLIMGHFSYGLHRFLSRPCVYVTLLRNPLERFCSFYLQLLRDHPYSRELVARNYSIEEHLREGEGAGRFWSRAQGQLTDMIFTPCGGGGDSAIEWTGLSNIRKDTQALKSRLSNSFMLVGLSERLDDFVFMLCRMMGWPPGALGHKNRNPGRISAAQMLSPEQVDRANKLLSTEWALYRHAEEIFQKKWKGLSTRERMHANCFQNAIAARRLFLTMRRRMV